MTVKSGSSSGGHPWKAVILEASRTPFARRGGAFRQIRPNALLAHALSELAGRSGVEVERVEDIVNGTVTQASEQGVNIGRRGILLASFPVTVPAVTLNRMCGSNQQAVHFASQAIAAGNIMLLLTVPQERSEDETNGDTPADGDEGRARGDLNLRVSQPLAIPENV